MHRRSLLPLCCTFLALVGACGEPASQDSPVLTFGGGEQDGQLAKSDGATTNADAGAVDAALADAAPADVSDAADVPVVVDAGQGADADTLVDGGAGSPIDAVTADTSTDTAGDDALDGLADDATGTADIGQAADDTGGDTAAADAASDDGSAADGSENAEDSGKSQGDGGDNGGDANTAPDSLAPSDTSAGVDAGCAPTVPADEVCDGVDNDCDGATDDVACSDGNPCTDNDSCLQGKCAGAVKVCDDGEACTDDTCDPKSTAGCTYAPNTKPCSDGNACTEGDACKDGKCAAGNAKSCDDSNPCTEDSCAPKAETPCQYAAKSGPCDDGNPCTKDDECATGSCVGKAIIQCDDGNVCTDDKCDPALGDKACSHIANTASCTDGSACTASGKCDAGSCKVTAKSCDDGNPCTGSACDPKGGVDGKGCTFPPADGAKCDDSKQCTTDDVCKGKACAGVPNPCDDKNACTVDSCTEGVGCGHLKSADGAACDDGEPCATIGTCKSGACEGIGKKSCDDGDPCTDDKCDPTGATAGNGKCVNTPHNGACDDGNKCTAAGTCDAGKCKPGPALSCDDGVICTADACDAAKGCVHTVAPGTYFPPCDGSVHGGYCYKAVNQWKNRADAEGICGNWGGHLASIHSNTEAEFVRSLSASCAKTTSGYSWIGLNDLDKEGTYVWTDKSPLNYTRWRKGEPNNFGNQEDAVAAFRSDGTWLDLVHWSATNCWVCKRKLPVACNDGNKCTTATTCQANGSCKGKAVSCDDGADCTADSCDPKLGCKHAAKNDGTVCGGQGKCTGGFCIVGTANNPGTSCKAIRLNNKNVPSGVRWLDADGKGPQGKFQAYCDMSAEGGGWTLVMKTDGSKGTFGYESNHWKATTALNADKPGLDQHEAKLLSYSRVPFTELRLGMKVGDQTRWITVPYTASSLYAAIADGKYRATSVGRAKWKSLVAGSSLQVHCNREGFNAYVSSSHARVRIGLLGNQQNNCSSPDSRLGFGARGSVCSTDNNNTCGNAAHSSCNTDNGTKNIKAFGYVMVR